MFLLDSGGQYLDGTTDTTRYYDYLTNEITVFCIYYTNIFIIRTLHFGEPDDNMKKCYTLVLKVEIRSISYPFLNQLLFIYFICQGHIGLARVVFPEGTLGSRLDTLARAPLWSAGLDFNHGTGHGVGAYLNVHEGPQSISFRKRDNETVIYFFFI